MGASTSISLAYGLPVVFNLLPCADSGECGLSVAVQLMLWCLSKLQHHHCIPDAQVCNKGEGEGGGGGKIAGKEKLYFFTPLSP